MSTVRTAREAELRETEYLDEMMHGLDIADNFHVPESFKRSGYAYRWLRMTIRGVEDHNVARARRMGWVLVEASRDPNYINSDPFGRQTDLAKYVTIGNIILAEIPDHYKKHRRALLDAKERKRVDPLIANYTPRDSGAIRPTHTIRSF